MTPKKSWQYDLTVIVVLLIGGLLLNTFFGHFLYLLLLPVSGLLLYHFYQAYRLERWLRTDAVGNHPKCKGVWGGIYYHLDVIKKTHKKRKKKLSSMVKQFRTSTAALPDAAVVLNSQDEIEWVNKIARQVLGLKKSDKGKPILNLIRNPEFHHFLNSHEENSSITLPSMVDENRLLEFMVGKYGVGFRLLLAHDVTKLKNMERMRKDFVANVSHEFRTPLTVLKGYLETLKDIDGGQSTLVSSSYTQMLSQTARMENLVEDLLQLARLETQKKLTRCVNIGRLLSEICKDTDVLQVAKGRIELQLESEACISGEERDLRSAFTNLIVNAVKYSSADSMVKVRWYETEDFLKLDVEDQGIGIAAELIPRITERFYRVDVNHSREMSGTGLGLAIVKHVLVRHNASLNISSTLGKGSCFSCWFPLNILCQETEPPQVVGSE